VVAHGAPSYSTRAFDEGELRLVPGPRVKQSLLTGSCMAVWMTCWLLLHRGSRTVIPVVFVGTVFLSTRGQHHAASLSA